ncbi:hypothetical protein CCO03_04760 [Comamonas serinivorans]|uniref:Uncharacterized protein n=1 Tax=Comamonas serinivorans TaxID=1082851 RepID=A0A1Y0EKB1_9BURK|nr:hypothetical protein [Comamonas serinivorans]ARU04075.1 hypothetical protein CCO03_04760 [Comamonas serinivorans]
MQQAWLDLPVLFRLHAQARGQQVAQPERADGVFAIQGTASAQPHTVRDGPHPGRLPVKAGLQGALHGSLARWMNQASLACGG